MAQPANNRAAGKTSEDLAAEFLTAKGMRIVKRNFHFGRVGEIDIIAEDGQALVFVEVKARSSTLYGTPEEAITPSKQRAIRKVAAGYLYTQGITDRECRFDVIAIRLFSNEPEITHLIAAF
ncbi:MAG: YraN family protein [Ignavibacteria bacterium]|nr:YraN family protein [Ignavibacteria bacterium]